MTYLAKRIQQLRKQSGLSQDKIAELLNMSRVTYNLIETNKRDLKNTELEKIAEIFETTVSELIDKPIKKTKKITSDHPLYKMIQTILFVLHKTAGKPNVWKIVINKLLYFADFNHYEKYWESITWDIYIKKPMWPVPKNMDWVIALMQKADMIQEISNNYYGYKQTKYIPNALWDKGVFNVTEIEDLDEVINNYSDKTWKQLTDFSHWDVPFQATTNIGDEISYNFAHYREGIYSVANKEDGNID